MSPAASPVVARAEIDSAVAFDGQSRPHFDQRHGVQPRRRTIASAGPLKMP